MAQRYCEQCLLYGSIRGVCHQGLLFSCMSQAIGFLSPGVVRVAGIESDGPQAPLPKWASTTDTSWRCAVKFDAGLHAFGCGFEYLLFLQLCSLLS